MSKEVSSVKEELRQSLLKGLRSEVDQLYLKRAAKDRLSKSDSGSTTTMWTAIAQVVFTGLLCWIGYSQLKALRDQIDSSNQSFQEGQKALVVPMGIQRTPVIVGQPARFYVTLGNLGKSPAKNVREHSRVIILGFNQKLDSNAYIQIQKETILDQIAELDLSTGDNDLAPTRSMVDTVFTSTPVSQQLKGMIDKGQSIAILFGRIEYDDIYSVHHRDTFCVYSDPNKPEMLQAAPYGNKIE